MSFTYDFATDPLISRVRLLVADTDANNPVFNDDEVNAALQMESSQGLFVSGQAASMGNGVAIPPIPQVYSVYRAAAILLDCLASNKARLSAIQQLLDVKLSPELAAKALRDSAQSYRDTEANAGHFAIAEMAGDDFSTRERVWKQLLRLDQG